MAILNFPGTIGQPTDGSYTYTENNVIYSWNGSYWTANNADNYLTVPSLNGGQLAGFRNLLINGDFRIWQRGTSGLPAPTAVNYYADRWASYKTSGQAVNDVQLISGSPPEIASGLSTRLNACDLRQCVESAFGLFRVGSTWTFSFWIKGASTGGSCTSSVSFAQDSGANPGTTTSITTQSDTISGTSWQYVTHTFTVAASPGSGQAQVMARLAVDFDAHVTGCQLEPGPVATPFENRPIGTELALCQRYFVRLSDDFALWSGHTAASASFATVHSLPVEMRALPTTSNITSWQSTSVVFASANIECYALKKQSVFFSCLAASQSVSAFFYAGADLDAEL